MRTRPLVEIVCDGNATIGFGHIRRSSALAGALQKENIDVRMTGLSEEARKLLPVFDKDERTARIIIFDVAEGIETTIEKAKQNGQTTVTLDWFGNAIPHVNIAVYPHAEVRGLIKTYIGFEYIILRDEICSLQPMQFNKQAQNVLVCLGGGDLLGQGFAAAAFLQEQGLTVTLVQGPLAKNIQGERGFTILINPPDFPELLAGCDWAVTNGGGCLFEALYLEKAVYVLPQTEWEMRIARFVENKGPLLGIGREGLRSFSASDLQKAIAGKEKMVDGQGAERITSIIKELL